MFAVACVLTLHSAGIMDVSMLISIPAAVIGALIPDIDDPKSKIGHRLLPISILINQFCGHRRFFHSLLFLVIIAGFTYWINRWFDAFLPIVFWLPLMTGIASHVIGDMLFGRHGVQLFWPHPARVKLLPMKLSVGGITEIVFLIATSLYAAFTWGRIVG